MVSDNRAVVVSGSRVRTGPVAQEAAFYAPPVMVATDPGREQYDGEEVSPVKLTAAEPVSTFAVDVDTGAYANARRFLTQGQMPPQAAVRTEEMINYFRYDYAKPKDRSQPFSVTTDVAKTPWNEGTYLMRIGLRGYDIASDERPPANLVFLMDVSGSMNSPDKLPLVKTALAGLAGELSPQDKVSIVVYAGAAGMVLEPTSDTAKIRRALDSLAAGGSTAGGAAGSTGWRAGSCRRVKLATRVAPGASGRRIWPVSRSLSSCNCQAAWARVNCASSPARVTPKPWKRPTLSATRRIKSLLTGLCAGA